MHRLFEGDLAYLGAPLEVFGCVLTDETCKRMDRTQALIARTDGAASPTLDLFQEEPNTIGGKVLHRQLLDASTDVSRNEWQ
jgi:hypothetical protein